MRINEIMAERSRNNGGRRCVGVVGLCLLLATPGATITRSADKDLSRFQLVMGEAAESGACLKGF